MAVVANLEKITIVLANNGIVPQLLPPDTDSGRALPPAGCQDFNINSQVAADWFSKVEAPSKHLVWFEHSGHLPMTEEPAKYLLALMTYARPLAKPVGDPV